jgi:hypothetical protein
MHYCIKRYSKKNCEVFGMFWWLIVRQANAREVMIYSNCPL